MTNTDSLSLKEARENDKLDEFIKEHEQDQSGDSDRMDAALASITNAAQDSPETTINVSKRFIEVLNRLLDRPQFFLQIGAVDCRNSAAESASDLAAELEGTDSLARLSAAITARDTNFLIVEYGHLLGSKNNKS